MKRATAQFCCYCCCFCCCCGFLTHSVNYSSNEIDDLKWNHPRWVGREPSGRRGYSCHNCEIFNLHRAKQQQQHQQQLLLLRKFPTSLLLRPPTPHPLSYSSHFGALLRGIFRRQWKKRIKWGEECPASSTSSTSPIASPSWYSSSVQMMCVAACASGASENSL